MPVGDVVGTTDTQTLTGKTISAEDNTLSGVLSLLSDATPYKIQFGQVSSVSVVNNSDTQITLPTAWGTSHVAFFAMAYPLTSWTGVYVGGGGPDPTTPLTKGFIHLWTGSTQNFKIFWVSIGY